MFPVNEHIIGTKIRQLRTAAGLTLTAVAELSNLTKSTVSKIETGQVSAPISTYIRIAEALGVQLADFFTESATSPPYVLTRKGNGHVISRDGSRFGYSYEALGLEMRDKHFEPFLLKIHPGDESATFQHPGQEFIYVLTGKIEFTIGSETLKLSPGDSLFFDPMNEHRVQVLGNRPATFLAFFSQP